MKPYVHSNYERIEDDNYQTVDPRCVRALEYTVPIYGGVVDCCAPSGSGIVDEFISLGRNAIGVGDAFSDFKAEWVVTNPPYKRPLVDQILRRQIERVSTGEFYGFAALLRNNFDFAKTRWDMFTSENYWGQVHMMFRPWWSTEKKHQPIHNFVWHVWGQETDDEPFVRYWKE